MNDVSLCQYLVSCDLAFNELKSAFLKEPVLRLPDFKKPFAFASDASKHATGGVLLQANSNGAWHPCSYISQSFTPAERNYDIYDRELLGIIHCLRAWRHYLIGSETPVTVFTDHKNLLYFKEARKLSRRQARWLLDLSDFDLRFHHIPGKDLITTDALSRRPDLIPDLDDDNDNITLLPENLFVNLLDVELSKKVALSSEKDPVVLDRKSVV